MHGLFVKFRNIKLEQCKNTTGSFFFFAIPVDCQVFSCDNVIFLVSIHNLFCFFNPSDKFQCKISPSFTISGPMCRLVIQRQNMRSMEQAFAVQILFSRECINAAIVAEGRSYLIRQLNECLVVLIPNSPSDLSSHLYSRWWWK